MMVPGREGEAASASSKGTDMQPDAPPTDDLELAAVPSWVKLAGGVLATAGVFGVFHVLQLVGLVSRLPGVFAALPPIMGVASVAAVVSGVAFARARSWSPWAAVVTAALLWLTTAVWFLFGFVNGFFTLFGLVVPAMGFGALVVTLTARKKCVVAAAARRRLEQQGLEFGV
jgi:hypothetical protein